MRVLQLPATGVDNLAATVRQATAPLVPEAPTDPPFNGHLTLARAKGRRLSVAALGEMANIPFEAAFPVDAIDLVSSEPSAGRSRLHDRRPRPPRPRPLTGPSRRHGATPRRWRRIDVVTTASRRPFILDDRPPAELSEHSNRELMDVIAESAKQMASLAATVVQHAGELDRREGWRDDGATSLEDWLVARLGVSTSTAKAYAHLSERLFDLPHLTAGLGNGDLSLDKVRAVADSATPESDRDLARQARDLSVRELADVARAKKRPTPARDQADQDHRSVRFNDLVRTVTAQLPPASYAEVRACLEARAKRVASDGETPFDQRLADAFVELIRGTGRRPGHRVRRTTRWWPTSPSKS